VTVEQLLAANKISIPSTAPGRYETTCPRCSAGRKTTAHKKAPVLGVTIDAKGVMWGCNHCDWKGPEKGNGSDSAGKWIKEGEWVYRDADEKPYLKVVRYRKPDGGKSYPQYHIEDGQWVKGKPPGPKIPYRLPELLDSDRTEPVYLVEGEKCADRVAKEGLAVTSASEGAGKWTADLNQHFADRIVWIIPDANNQGRDHARNVAKNLYGVAKEVRIVDLPISTDRRSVHIGGRELISIVEGEDVYEFLANGGDEYDLRALGEAAPTWTTAQDGEGLRGNPQPKNKNPRKRTTGKDLRTMRFNPVSFLIPGLIPNEGVTLICSKPKVGKSWLLLDVAIAATMDRYLLGDKKPEQGDVLCLFLEDSLRRIQSRMTKLLPTFNGEWPESLTFETEWRRVDQGGLDDIREWANEVRAAGRKISFVAIDVLKMVRPPAKKNQSSYESDYEAIVGLRSLSIELGIPIIVIHHTRKADADDLIDKVSSTTGLTGAVDAIIIIDRQPSGMVFDIRGRDIESDTLAVEFNKNTCRWTILGSAETIQRSAERTEILKIFADAAEPLTPKAVTDRVNCDRLGKPRSHDSIRQILIKMAKNGDLNRPEPGKYTLPTTPQSHRSQ
jgi:AAA domain